MFQIRNVNGAMPFPEDRGWKDTVWVDGQVELLVYFGQPSRAHFPFYFNSQTLEMADRGSIGQLLVNPVLYLHTRPRRASMEYLSISLSFRLIIPGL